MTIFFAVYFLIGFLTWLKLFIEFYNHPIIRPGLVALFVLLLAAPIMHVNNLFEQL